MQKAREELLRDLIKQLMFVTKQIGPHQKLGADLPVNFELSTPQARLFFAIADRKDGVSVKELADEFSITSGAVSQFVDALVSKQLVRRQEDHSDRRMVRLSVTEEIQEHHEKIKNEYVSAVMQKFETLNDLEIIELIGLLNKVCESPVSIEKKKEK